MNIKKLYQLLSEAEQKSDKLMREYTLSSDEWILLFKKLEVLLTSKLSENSSNANLYRRLYFDFD